jgi:multiple sugar transport system substrate-binding protein
LTHLVLAMLLAFSAIVSAQQTITVAVNPVSAPQRKLFLELVQRFNAEHADLQAKAVVYEHESYKARVLGMAADQRPAGDVMFWFAGERLNYLASQGLVHGLDALWRNSALHEQFAPAVKQTVSLEGTPYALPLNYYQWGIYYKKSILHKHGLTPPRTWDELTAVVKALRAQRVIPFVLSSAEPWTLAGWFDYLNLRLNGMDFHLRLLRGEESFLDARVKAVFAHWQELATLGAFTEQHRELSWNDALPLFHRDRAAMMLMGNFFVADLPPAVKQDLGFIAFPTLDPQVGHYEEAPMDVAFIPANSPNKAHGERFLTFLAQAEQQAWLNNQLGKNSPNHHAEALDIDFIAQGKALLAGADGFTQFFDRDTHPTLAAAGLKAFQRFMDQPQRADEICQELEQVRLNLFGPIPTATTLPAATPAPRK